MGRGSDFPFFGHESCAGSVFTVVGVCDRCARKASLTRMAERLFCPLCLALERRERARHRGPERRREASDPRRFGRRHDDPQE